MESLRAVRLCALHTASYLAEAARLRDFYRGLLPLLEHPPEIATPATSVTADNARGH